MLSDDAVRASLCVAPLDISQTQPVANGSSHPSQPSTDVYLRSQMTPPATPNGSQEDLLPDEAADPPVFNSFLRAYYPFEPSGAMTECSVTIALNEGDVVLVHSVHTNGWADGTLLATGARGWLPTNYCSPYYPEPIRGLLKALLNFWDLLRSASVDDNEIFKNQEFIKGIIAGVRFLLDRSGLLARESVVAHCDALRRARKVLLSELSQLVKTAKRLQECHSGTLEPAEDVNDIIDEMILKALKIVTKGVRFLDILEEEKRSRDATTAYSTATTVDELYVPPTPPADQTNFGDSSGPTTDDVASRHARAEPPASGETPALHPPSAAAPWGKRLSSLQSSGHEGQPSVALRRLSQASVRQSRRLSGSMAHRVSLAGPSPLSRPQHLASERISRSHDKFLSYLGSFIGRLNVHSHSRPGLALAVKQSATSGGELLAVIDGVCGYNSFNFNALGQVRAAMFERIQALILAARDILGHASAEEGSDIILPNENQTLLAAATMCVKAAGECVSKAKAAVERAGDFEIELPENSLELDLSALDAVIQERSRPPSVTERADPNLRVEPSFHVGETTTASRPQRPSLSTDKPLPRVPKLSIPATQHHNLNRSPASSGPCGSLHDEAVSSAASSVSSARPATRHLPSYLQYPSLHGAADHMPGLDASRNDTDAHASRFDSLAASSAGSTTTYLSRDSETSIVSQTSTRATTPDHGLVPRSKPSMSELSSFSHADDADDDVEARLLERTYAHELMFNKEGQVTGGSLPALVERLTTHESTPDAAFVSTFYLTFRLFCTPVKLTEALIDRFDYVGESPHMAVPVRLRVYNVFKGWLESHWRDRTDREALKLVIPFAEQKLGAVLSSAGRRLLELAKRVSGDGSLVPRLVSSMGKTNTAIGQYVPAETPVPHPALSKSQLHALSAFRAGGSAPSILDLEPLELARQLTVRQMSIFCSILPEELLASQWMKKGGVDAPHVKAMSSLSTDLSNLVAETVLQHPEIKKRAAVIKQWIKIANHCYELHNYDGLMAIICSLNSSTISRLRKTWDAVSPKRKDMLRALQDLVEPSQNHKVLRTRLHDHVPPCLPFLGMYLTDLTFVDIGNPATKHLSLGGESDDPSACGLTVVNFDKHCRTAKIIGELQRFQIPYRLLEVPEMQEWWGAQIRRVRAGDQGKAQVTYYRKSLLLEPREPTPRRDHNEPPTPATSSSTGQSRPDLFGWMSRDRGGHTPAPAPV
ncbi:Ras guanine-nucleotide exchange protein [Ophiocordyceps camponoti-floridani]|uniref:Ras guanine-nucleotide exchange protein n=1 Tax=Ophiocordyceps camponoti-floridani TaxID=2030778 RepID=A0A8H4Q971_9HYPO|nr:Ras guanine-nucleotide exchange protein [Ophiocordyceps camponoti-floridani]